MRMRYITENALLDKGTKREKKAKGERRKTIAVPTTPESFHL